MASEALVRADIDAGLNLIKALDGDAFGVVAALWLYNSDLETWRMVIAYAGEPSQIEEKYRQAAYVASAWRKSHPNIPILDLSKVRITSGDDHLIEALKGQVEVSGTAEVRLSHSAINGIYVEDAVIHRLAA